jgi:hypothetical protein
VRFEAAAYVGSLSILDKALALVRGTRQESYGHPLDNHQRITRLWNARLHEKLAVPLTEEDVTACMRLVKEARLIESPGHEDSLVDIAGYADVESEIHLERLRRNWKA